MHSALAAVLRLFFLLFSCIPARWCGAIGAGLGRLVFLIDGRHRKVALDNLSMVYAKRPSSWHKRIARESFAEMGRTVMELPHVYMRSKASLLACVEIEGKEVLDTALASGDGVMLMACHHSNWELGALVFSMLGYKTHIIYRPLNQPSVEDIVKTARERFGAQFHARTAPMRWLLQALKNHDVVCVMVDQHMSTGTVVPFLGHPAYTTLLPASMHSKRETPLLCVAARRIGRDFRFRINVWRPRLKDGGDPISIMSNIMGDFAPIIEERPELWLWMHKRWRVEQDVAAGSEAAHGAS